MLVELATKEEIQTTQPMEAAAETLAAVLQKECGITPTPSVDAQQVSTSISAATPGPRESSTQPELVTGGSPWQAQTDKVVTMAETLLNELITWKEMVDEERTAEQQAPQLRQRLARCEKQLGYKGTVYNIAVFERDQLRSAQVEKDRQIERLKAELEAEKKAYREVERSRADARADIKSLHRRHDIAKKDAADADSRLGISMESLSQLMKEKDEWKCTQKKWAVDIEKLSQDNDRLRTAEEKSSAEVQTLRTTKEKAEHETTAIQAEWAAMKSEWQIATVSAKKCKVALANADAENRRLVRELEKGQMLAHANVKRLLQRFREATTAEI
jgi:chromosome segregation ATPase